MKRCLSPLLFLVALALVGFDASFGAPPTAPAMAQRQSRQVGTAAVLAAMPAASPTGPIIYIFRGQMVNGRNVGDGDTPESSLIFDSSGALYGTTKDGGKNNLGCVFRITHSASGFKSACIYSFSGTDGANPTGPLTVGHNSGVLVLYGTTMFGGPGWAGANTGFGTVFALKPNKTSATGWSLQAQYPFVGNHSPFPTAGGANPTGNVIPYRGSLYGTTSNGGLVVNSSPSPGVVCDGCGTVFKITLPASGIGGTEQVLHSFNKDQGMHPMASLAFRQGLFWGVTYSGGPNPHSANGVAFRITPAGAFTPFYTFGVNKPNDGTNPHGMLFLDSDQNLLGTSYSGGVNNQGIIFKLMPSRSQKECVIHSFQKISTSDGALPQAGLILGPNGAFYGTTEGGGAHQAGTVFKLTKNSNADCTFGQYTEKPIHSFQYPLAGAGGYPDGELLWMGGFVYGTTRAGGLGHGTVFRIAVP